MKAVRLVIALAFAFALLLTGFVHSGEPPKKEKEKPRPKVKPIKIQDKLDENDPLDWQQSGSFHKVHTVKLKTGVLYGITMTANYPPYIRVEDHRGNILVSTQQFNGQTSNVEFAPEKDEEFRIVAASLGGRQMGPYTIDVNVRETVAIFKDQLTGKEPFDPARPNCYHKVHLLKLAPGSTYVIHSTTTVNDGWLRLEDSKKNQLGSNDDWMNTRNSRLVFTPTKADTYRIIQTTCGQGTTGPYTITVTKQ